MKREIQFLDAAGIRAILNVEITTRNGYPEFTMSGRYAGSSGQCIDHINPLNEYQKELIATWKAYHLKDISKVLNFEEKLIQTLEAIEKAEAVRLAAAEKTTGDDAILDHMREYGISAGLLKACKAYIELGISDDLSDFEESYIGEFASDEDFAREEAESAGMIDDDATWPNNCIDWERAARELMYDYSESDGYYFRNM